MEEDEFRKNLRQFREGYAKAFAAMTDQELVDSHNRACGIRAWGWYVTHYTNARMEELKKRFPDTSRVIYTNERGMDSYSLRKCGVWIAYINGLKTLACAELDEHPPTAKTKVKTIREDDEGQYGFHKS